MCLIYIILITIIILVLYLVKLHYYDKIHAFSKVHTHIYLSSYKSANNENSLKKYNIKNILTIMPICNDCNKMIKYDGINYLQIDRYDVKNENLKKEFEKCYNFIDKAIGNKENILIHCRKGKSRSPTIVASYLMKKYKMGSNGALEYLKKHRSIVKPNSGFKKQLDEYENEIQTSK